MLVSATGRRHYLDMKAEMLDARKSAEAVRELLEDAKGSICRFVATKWPTGRFARLPARVQALANS